MGKGDRRTTRGKISISSYGNKRPHRAKTTAVTKPVATRAGKPAVKSTAAKSAATKSAATKSAATKAPAKKAAVKKKDS